MTLDDVKGFYATQYRQAQLVIGIGGGYPAGFVDKVKADFKALPDGLAPKPRLAQAQRTGRPTKPWSASGKSCCRRT